tara:strand:+ start:27 stop:155 length:129 start_codon:yes stop_codon:yes gene_type:complete
MWILLISVKCGFLVVRMTKRIMENVEFIEIISYKTILFRRSN